MSRGPADWLCGKHGACHPPALDQLHRARAPVWQRHHPSRARLQAPSPSDAAPSLPQPGLSSRSGSMTGRNPQGQPTPRAKLRADGHGEGLLHAVLSVKLSAPPQGKHRRRRRAAGPVEAGGTHWGHTAPEPPRATVLVAAHTQVSVFGLTLTHSHTHTAHTRHIPDNRHTPDTRPTQAKQKGAHPHTGHTHTQHREDTHHTHHTWGV